MILIWLNKYHLLGLGVQVMLIDVSFAATHLDLHFYHFLNIGHGLFIILKVILKAPHQTIEQTVLNPSFHFT